MKYDPKAHHRRRSIRLPSYDYAQAGAYFLTVVTHRRQCLFGEMVDGQVLMNVLGEAAREEWRRTGEIRREVVPDIFVVMPNHIHGIVIIGERPVVGAHGRAPLQLHRPPRSLGSFVAGFKSAVTRRINGIRGTPGLPVWQRNYYEHVIRNEDELDHIRRHIMDNPASWEQDPENRASQSS